MRRLKQLEDENTKPRKLVAGLSLDKKMLQGVIRRKLWGQSGSASWSTPSAWIGTSRSGGPVRSLNSPPSFFDAFASHHLLPSELGG